METIRVDTNGLRCPQPVLMLAHHVRGKPMGTLIEVSGDCPTFEKDVRAWAERERKTVLAVLGVPPRLTIQVRV
ncbi:MAG TPA: sulfurtransferase TusA family protein [Anaeromyxobacter sp.]|nr:sulfurtransferase TusA family protein [Anaeromyxobacter sp.]